MLEKLEIKPSVVNKLTSTTAVATLKKEFKLNRNIGEGPSCIGYMSFMRQLDSATKKGTLTGKLWMELSEQYRLALSLEVT